MHNLWVLILSLRKHLHEHSHNFQSAPDPSLSSFLVASLYQPKKKKKNINQVPMDGGVEVEKKSQGSSNREHFLDGKTLQWHYGVVVFVSPLLLLPTTHPFSSCWVPFVFPSTKETPPSTEKRYAERSHYFPIKLFLY